MIFLCGFLLRRASNLLTFTAVMPRTSSLSTATILSSSFIFPMSGLASLISHTYAVPPSGGVSTMTPSFPAGAMTSILTSGPDETGTAAATLPFSPKRSSSGASGELDELLLKEGLPFWLPLSEKTSTVRKSEDSDDPPDSRSPETSLSDKLWSPPNFCLRR